MRKDSNIAWTGPTWNPVSGCNKITAGCDNCYAFTFAERFRGVRGNYYEKGFDLQLRPTQLEVPKRWHEHRKVFVNSMSDLFHKDIPFDYLERVYETMRLCPQHIFQILTKRPEPMRRLVPKLTNPPLPNVWYGVTIEDDSATWRADMLRETPAAIRFLSLEPLLGPLPSLKLDGIDWAIVGGESGHGARPMDLSWVRDLRDRCVNAGVPFFMKQMGTVAARTLSIPGKGEKPEEWPEEFRLREYPISYDAEFYNQIAASRMGTARS